MTHLSQIRDACEPRRHTGSKDCNNETPAWRVNSTLEQKALDKLFSRHKATTEAEKDALTDKIVDNIKAQRRYRKLLRNSKAFVSQPRQLSVYLNSDGHMDEFEAPTSELKADKQVRGCYVPDCQEDAIYAHTESLKVCKTHLDESAPPVMLREYWAAHYAEDSELGSMLRVSKDCPSPEDKRELLAFAKTSLKKMGAAPRGTTREYAPADKSYFVKRGWNA